MPRRTRSRRYAYVLAPLAALALLLAGCSQHESKAEPSPPTTGPPDGPATLTVHDSYGVGTVLVNGSGRMLYLSMDDGKSQSRCYSSCAGAWPPLLTKGSPHAGKGADQSLVGTTQRKDGSTQVTYNGHPLYRYSEDLVPGQGRGVGKKTLGTTWYPLTPEGAPLSLNGPIQQSNY